MTELITIEQANRFMMVFVIVALGVGLAWGISAKRVKTGLLCGIAVGFGNLILWRVYNAITDRLGLDTVKNLLTNLGLFACIGLVGGFVLARIAHRSKTQTDEDIRVLTNEQGEQPGL